MIGNDGSSRLPADSYQQYQMESTQQQAQPKQDDYYTISPGENYYTEYGVDDNQGYSGGGYSNPHVPTTVSNTVASVEQHNLQSPYQQQQQPDYSTNLTNIEPVVDTHIPNYLQSDTDDSQRDVHQNNATNKPPQNNDSDFDFSTNSDMN